MTPIGVLHDVKINDEIIIYVLKILDMEVPLRTYPPIANSPQNTTIHNPPLYMAVTFEPIMHHLEPHICVKTRRGRPHLLQTLPPLAPPL